MKAWKLLAGITVLAVVVFFVLQYWATTHVGEQSQATDTAWLTIFLALCVGFVAAVLWDSDNDK